MGDGPSKVWIHGITGRMGEALRKVVGLERSQRWSILGGSAAEDVSDPIQGHRHALSAILDFSLPDGTERLTGWLSAWPQKGPLPVLLCGTTGLGSKHLDALRTLVRTAPWRVLVVPNTSVGLRAVLAGLKPMTATLTAARMSVEMVEMHHRGKKDKPSGTAKILCNQVARYCDKALEPSTDSIPVHSIRGGNVFGEHQVLYLGEDEVVTVTHRVTAREVFARGALDLVEWLEQQDAGRIYTWEDLGS